MHALAETEVHVVALHLERVCQFDIVERPASREILDVVSAVGHPDANVLPWFAANAVGDHLAALETLLRLPLESGVAAHVRQHAAEPAGVIPGNIESTDGPGRCPGNCP